MHRPDKDEFLQRAKRGNLVPVWREVLADQETPVAAYQRIRSRLREADDQAPTFLLESVEGGEQFARYSFLGGNPRTTLQYRDGMAEIRERGRPPCCHLAKNGLDALKSWMARFNPVPDPDLPPFFGGAVGYIAYDAIARFEPRVSLAGGPGLGMPEMAFLVTDTILVFDRIRHTVKVVANAFIEGAPEAAYVDALQRIDALCALLETPLPSHIIDIRRDAELPEIESRSNVERTVFENGVRRAKEYIRAGDIIQVVLSQRFETEFDGDPLDVYRALRFINPSPYMFCLDFGSQALVGSSPEIHVKCTDHQVEIRPIAGTRPRSEDPAEDCRLAEELLADPKERAEHVMLVDLARNDIGRVCTFGSVRVPRQMFIERYSHVMHIVSDVDGTLLPDRDAYDLMRATFPAGTVSGAPKIRAMEIIAELEQVPRGPYSGAVSYFGFTGNLDSCIAIRTVVMAGGKAYVQAGAGIVADSDPGMEFEETRNKARGMLKALALAKRYAEDRRRPFSP
jgi:anthranilate synthase component 1